MRKLSFILLIALLIFGAYFLGYFYGNQRSSRTGKSPQELIDRNAPYYQAVTLKSGAITVGRPDGAAWLDASAGFTDTPGWYFKGGTAAPYLWAPKTKPFRLMDGTESLQKENGDIWLSSVSKPGWYSSSTLSRSWNQRSPYDVR